MAREHSKKQQSSSLSFHEDQERWYADLPAHDLSHAELLTHPELFLQAPLGWDVIATDIADSTSAVADGRGREVNVIAAATLAAGLNIARAKHLHCPFIFCGDGAALVVPPRISEQVLRAQQSLQHRAFASFRLRLRSGSISVARLLRDGHEVRVAKRKRVGGIPEAVFLGSGMREAEELVKHREIPPLPEGEEAASSEADLMGLECRWKDIPPPHKGDEIVNLIIFPLKPNPVLMRDVLQCIESVYGKAAERHPLATDQLQLTNPRQAAARELALHPRSLSRTLRAGYVALETTAGKALFSKPLRGIARSYVDEISEATDALKINGSISTVLAGSKEQRKALLAALRALEEDGKILFGHSLSEATTMTCYVTDRRNAHVHFLDGKDGGYTRAALELKQKKARNTA